MDARGISSSSPGPGQISEGQREQLQKTRDAALDAAADTLGESADALRTELQSGKSLADVAKDRGLSRDSLLDAVTKAVQSSDSKLSSDQVGNIAERLVSGHHHRGGRPPEGPPPAPPSDGGSLPTGSTFSVKA
jgi:hypothetical protein